MDCRLLCPWDFPLEHWSGLPFPSLGDIPDPGIEPMSSVPTALVGRFFTTEAPGMIIKNNLTSKWGVTNVVWKYCVVSQHL